jgi:heme-degrading monooxygenase HmoA
MPAKSVNCPANPRFPRYCAGIQQELRTMFIAMNRFKVRKGAEADFEQVWLNRDSHLNDVPGFLAFHLLKGPERDDHVLYASHSLWRSEAAFLDWTRSEAFRKAHAGAGAGKPLYLGHPEFEGFTVLQEMKADRAGATAAG